MCKRSLSRVAFGKPVAEQGVTLERIAEARILIDQARLLVLNAAHMMDTVGNKVAAKEIAMIKVAAPAMACQVIDWAIQVQGGGGMADPFLAHAYASARSLAGRRPGRSPPLPDRQDGAWPGTNNHFSLKVIVFRACVARNSQTLPARVDFFCTPV
jgi:hypothetical protein